MKPIRTLIVDDEELCRQGIRILLAKDNTFQILGECANGKDAVREIKTQNPDVVFLDIKMPEISGFDVLKRLHPDKWPMIVFITAYDEHAVKAFEVHALDYVLKPFTEARFRKTLEKIKKTVRERDASAFTQSMLKMISSLETPQAEGKSVGSEAESTFLDRLLISDRGTHDVVWVKDIEWIEGADYYVYLRCRGKSYLLRERLKNLEEKLSPENFFRVHKSAIINLSFLEKIIADHKNQFFALMKSGAKVRISRSRKKDFFDLCRTKYGLIK